MIELYVPKQILDVYAEEGTLFTPSQVHDMRTSVWVHPLIKYAFRALCRKMRGLVADSDFKFVHRSSDSSELIHRKIAYGEREEALKLRYTRVIERYLTTDLIMRALSNLHGICGSLDNLEERCERYALTSYYNANRIYQLLSTSLTFSFRQKDERTRLSVTIPHRLKGVVNTHFPLSSSFSALFSYATAIRIIRDIPDSITRIELKTAIDNFEYEIRSLKDDFEAEFEMPSVDPQHDLQSFLVEFARRRGYIDLISVADLASRINIQASKIIAELHRLAESGALTEGINVWYINE